MEEEVRQIKIVSGRDRESVEEEINELINDGWQPLGNVATAFNTNTYDVVITQVMSLGPERGPRLA